MTKARVSLNLPASLKAAAEDYAERDGVSLNQLIALACNDSEPPRCRRTRRGSERAGQ